MQRCQSARRWYLRSGSVGWYVERLGWNGRRDTGEGAQKTKKNRIEREGWSSWVGTRAYVYIYICVRMALPLTYPLPPSLPSPPLLYWSA